MNPPTLIITFVLLALVLAGCLPLPAELRPGTTTPTPGTTPAPSLAAQPASPGRARAAELVPEPTPGACLVTDTGALALNVRAAPDLGAAILGGLAPGQRVKVLSWGDQWHKIDSGKYAGYVYAIYCKDGEK